MQMCQGQRALLKMKINFKCMNFTNKTVPGPKGTARYENTFQMYELHQFKTDIDKHFMSIKMIQGQRALLAV